MKRTPILAALAGVGLSACAGMSTDGTGSGQGFSSDCNGGGPCKVAISVTQCKIATPLPDPIVVDKGKHGVKIEWELDHASWLGGNRFSEGDGIVVKEAKGQFEPESTGNNKKYRLKDKNDVAGDFKYTIHVKSVWFGDCPVLDPTIKNQG